MRDRFLAFVAARAPHAALWMADACDRAAVPPDGAPAIEVAAIERAAAAFDRAARERWPSVSLPVTSLTPAGAPASTWLEAAREDLLAECAGFFRREAIAASLTPAERVEILRGMILTRAVDNRLKLFFGSGEVRYAGAPFQGKGFRSLGQEAIYAATIRLRRGAAFRTADGRWQGDVVAPIIRDLGAALGMRPEPALVRAVLSAQMAKAGPPMDGRDLHLGDLSWGILPAAAPLATSALTAAGMGLAFQRLGEPRVAVTFIGEGGTSLGEWHEAINLCGARRLPVVFIVENNQTALSTPVAEQTAARLFADKAAGYGMPGLTLDGTDPEAIAAAVTWAADRARAGDGPTLVELVSMRMCGHAHHDDMLYLGKEPAPGWTYPPVTASGYADAAAYEQWRARDPLVTYARRLDALGLIEPGDVDRFKREADALVDVEARAVVDAPWPDPAGVTSGVFAQDPVRRTRVDPMARSVSPSAAPAAVESAPPFDPKGATFLDAVMLGIGDALEADPRTFVFGEDVGGKYGNAFLLLRPLLARFGDRIVNSTLAEGAVLGASIGAALAGLRPIAEMQFNDFVATGFNQLVNNAAKVRYRWGGSVPMVVRMPWGGLRHAGPYHSQNTEPWFYRTPGLKIVVPSTPHDARAALAAAVADEDPVLYYEHIALYRDPRIKQRIDPTDRPAPLLAGRAALRREGDDLVLVSYGAYVHAAMRVADRLAASDGIDASVLDLRWLAPLDRDAILAAVRRANRVLIVHEDTRTGGVGESIAAMIQEEAFEDLDAPVRILGALDIPVPYSPPLEAAFLVSEDELYAAAVALARY